MACIQQQPVSAALYTGLIKWSAFHCMEGLKEKGESGIVVLSASTITPSEQTQRFRLTHLTFEPPWEEHQGREKRESRG